MRRSATECSGGALQNDKNSRQQPKNKTVELVIYIGDKGRHLALPEVIKQSQAPLAWNIGTTGSSEVRLDLSYVDTVKESVPG